MLFTPNGKEILLGKKVRTRYFDIGLIFLSEPLNFTSNVIAVCLPTKSQSLENFVGHTVTSQGWGREAVVDDDDEELKVTQIDVTIRSKQYCNYLLRKIIDRGTGQAPRQI